MTMLCLLIANKILILFVHRIFFYPDGKIVL